MDLLRLPFQKAQQSVHRHGHHLHCKWVAFISSPLNEPVISKGLPLSEGVPPQALRGKYRTQNGQSAAWATRRRSQTPHPPPTLLTTSSIACSPHAHSLRLSVRACLPACVWLWVCGQTGCKAMNVLRPGRGSCLGPARLRLWIQTSPAVYEQGGAQVE